MDADAFVESLVDDPQLHGPLHTVMGALKLFGIDPTQPGQQCDFALALDTSRSTANERGINPRTLQPIAGAPDVMRVVVYRLAAILAALDRNQSALAITYNTEPHRRASITPRNYARWYDTNMPPPHGRTMLGRAMELLLEMIGDEQHIPALKELAEAAQRHMVRRDTPTTRLPRIRLKTPVNVIATVEGDISDAATVEGVLSITRAIPALRWTLIFASRESIGREMLDSFRHANPNVHLCMLPEGIEAASLELFYVLFFEGMREWLAGNLDLL